MFILYAIPIGIVAGYLLGGRLERLATSGSAGCRWRCWALLIQVAFFSEALGALFGDAAPAIYVASNLLVLAAVLRNLRVPGMALAAVGAGMQPRSRSSPTAAYMPADPEALASVGLGGPGYTNSVVKTDPALPFLTDIFAMPSWLPLANVFSIGDVLLGRRRRRDHRPRDAPAPCAARTEPAGRAAPPTPDPSGRRPAASR